MKIVIVVFLFFCKSVASASPTPFPVFLKAGFSSVLEFESTPTKVVLGDSQKFQIEKLDRSLVIKTLVPFASTNMFVYFRDSEPRLFVLTASEDAQPTYYKKFDPPLVIPPTAKPSGTVSNKSSRILSTQFDEKKDYLTVEIELVAGSTALVKPNWGWARLTYKNSAITPSKLWAERREIQKDTRVKARMTFTKPNIPKDMSGASLVIPVHGSLSPISLSLNGSSR